MNESDLITALVSVKGEILAAVPAIAGLQSTIDTLQSAVAQLEAQVAAQPAGNYSQAVIDAVQALLAAALRMHGQINPTPVAPTVTAPGTAAPLPVLTAAI